MATVLVSDAPEVRRLLRVALEMQHHAVLEATPGEGWRGSPRPDIVIAAQPAPFLDLGARIIYVSGHLDWTVAQRCDAVLEKPFRVHELVGTIEALAAGSRADLRG